MKRTIRALSILALIVPAACSPGESGQDAQDSVASDRPVQASQSDAGAEIARLAGLVVDAPDDRTQMVERLQELDDAIVRLRPNLAERIGIQVQADLDSARDAASSQDWTAVRKAASSIRQKLASVS